MEAHRRWILVTLLFTILGVALVAIAFGSTARTYRPTIIGVIRDRVEAPGGAHRVTLEGGSTVVVDPRIERVVDGSAQPNRGHLLLAGSSPGPWYATLRRSGTCFWVGGRGVEEGEEIRFPSGIVLPKARRFDRAHYHESEHEFNGAGFCVSATGEVIAVR